ncbi:hypothetical protein TanjilG_18524 [Lupinus angustifolius]|uniref:Uncharacterized protein n=1 Tax=Lupinus angustifolius TaxID=3871 RepID=A0A4P1RXG7_LUPAN|nr:hypothetical protein TanjilG_18524 [Lupinus angustifolius]
MKHSQCFYISVKYNYQLQQSGNGGVDSMATCHKLMRDLQAVFHVLSRDTQDLVLSKPQRASLLKVSPE